MMTSACLGEARRGQHAGQEYNPRTIPGYSLEKIKQRGGEVVGFLRQSRGKSRQSQINRALYLAVDSDWYRHAFFSSFFSASYFT